MRGLFASNFGSMWLLTVIVISRDRLDYWYLYISIILCRVVWAFEVSIADGYCDISLNFDRVYDCARRGFLITGFELGLYYVLYMYGVYISFIC